MLEDPEAITVVDDESDLIKPPALRGRCLTLAEPWPFQGVTGGMECALCYKIAASIVRHRIFP